MNVLERTYTRRFVYNDAGRRNSKRPKQKNDCTVRSMALVFNIPYDRAYDLLKSSGRKAHQGYHFDEWAASEKVDGKQLKWHYFKMQKGKPRMNLIRFVDQFPQGRFILRTIEHVFAVVDGVAYDDVEPDYNWPIYGAWELMNNA